MTRTHPEPRLPDNINALTRHFTLPALRPQGTTPPLRTTHRATGEMAGDQDPHNIPTQHMSHKPRQHRANAIAFTHLSWSEAELVSEVFTFRAGLGKRGLAGAPPTG